MKHLKYFESNGDFFESLPNRISESEYDRIHEEKSNEPFTKYEIGKLNELTEGLEKFWNTPKWEFTFIKPLKVPSYFDEEIDIRFDITKFEDEWYTILAYESDSLSFDGDSEFYICDQLRELINFINKI